MEPVFTPAVQLLSYSCNVRQRHGNSHLISLYQNNPGGSNTSVSQACQLCGFLTSPSFFMPHYLVHPFPPELFSLDNPYLSSCCLTPISISHRHTLHHSSLLYPLPTLLPLSSEALETRRWLLYTMAPVFTLLFTCLQTALTTFREAQRPPIHRGPFVPLYIAHT